MSEQSKSLALFKEVQALEIVARNNVTSLLSGNYLTTFAGTGFQFHEARKYISGESVKSIDWNMTARMNEPYVRVVNDERQREVIVALDISPSMRVGWQGLSKLDYALELSATLAVSAIDNGDKFGFTLFSDRLHQYAKPRSGKRQLHHALRSFSQAKTQAIKSKLSDPRIAIKQIQQQRGRKFIIFIISDFIDKDVPDDIRYLQKRHDVSLVHVYDDFEFNRADNIFFNAHSPEGRPHHSRVTANVNLDEFTAELKQQCRKLNIHFFSFSTLYPPTYSLLNLFNKKRMSQH